MGGNNFQQKPLVYYSALTDWFCPCFKTSRIALGSKQPPVQGVPASFPWEKAAEA